MPNQALSRSADSPIIQSSLLKKRSLQSPYTMTQITKFFRFETDFVGDLRCIPMQVRLKLDTCGIKLKLPQWVRFTPQERETLVEMPCQTPSQVQAYRKLLEDLVLEHMGEAVTELAIDPNPAWESLDIPTSVQEKAEAIGVNLTPIDWAKLTLDQRFALIKLSRSHHENHNFIPALQEFGIT
jgi:hypothetical protein